MLRWYTTVVDARDHSAQAAWWSRVLADPEGNEFCLLSPRPE
jgi:predicted enzyme related to lactoylglutathione lyase